MQLFDEFLGPLREYRSSTGSELRGHQTGVAVPSKIHVQSRRLQVFHAVVRNAAGPPGASVFSFTLSDDRSRPRMRQRREIDFSRRDRGRLPVRRPARSVLVDDVESEVLAMDDGPRCRQEAGDERPEVVAQGQQPREPIFQPGEQLFRSERPPGIVGLIVRPEESQALARDAASVRGMKSPNPSGRAHHGVRVAGVTALDAALQVLDDEPRDARSPVVKQAVESGRRRAERVQDVPIDTGLIRHVAPMAEDAVEPFRPVFDEQSQRASGALDAAGHDLRGEGALVRIPLPSEYRDTRVRGAVASEDRSKPGGEPLRPREAGPRAVRSHPDPPSTSELLQPPLPTADKPRKWVSTSSVIRLFPPGSRIKIKLHARSVLGRWAIISVVRPFISRWSASRIVASVWTSRELVGSSRMRIGASLRNARASEMRCRSPPDSFIPRSPTWVSYPSGRLSMKSCASANSAASTTSSIVASGTANRMFSAMLVEKSKVSCKTTPNWIRRSATRYCLRSTPSKVIAPSIGTKNRTIRLDNVVLPEPVGPTTPRHMPGEMSNEIWRRTG